MGARPSRSVSGLDRPTVALVGLDTRAGQQWTWRWHDRDIWSTPHLVDAEATRQVRNLLSGALPGRAGAASEELSTPGAPGPLASAETEWAYSALLARLLLPPLLGEELRARAASHGSPVVCRVFPSPSTAAVPWELLPVGSPPRPGLRLLDVADVVHMGGGTMRHVAASSVGNGEFEVFAVSADGRLWRQAPWSGVGAWQAMNGWASKVAAAKNPDGRVEVAHVGGSGSMWHSWQRAVGTF